MSPRPKLTLADSPEDDTEEGTPTRQPDTRNEYQKQMDHLHGVIQGKDTIIAECEETKNEACGIAARVEAENEMLKQLVAKLQARVSELEREAERMRAEGWRIREVGDAG